MLFLILRAWSLAVTTAKMNLALFRSKIGRDKNINHPEQQTGETATNHRRTQASKKIRYGDTSGTIYYGEFYLWKVWKVLMGK